MIPDDLKAELEKVLPCETQTGHPCTNLSAELGWWCASCRARAAVTPILERLVEQRDSAITESASRGRQLFHIRLERDDFRRKLAAVEAERDELRHNLLAWQRVADVNIEAQSGPPRPERQRREAYQIEVVTSLINEKAAAEAERDELRDSYDKLVKSSVEKVNGLEALLARRPHLEPGLGQNAGATVAVKNHFLNNEFFRTKCDKGGGACAK